MFHKLARALRWVSALTLCPLLFSQSANPEVPVHLEVPAGTPLRLYVPARTWFRKGAPVSAKVIEPVWAFDRIVIPTGSFVEGNISALQKVPALTRARAILNGDFTPLKKAELSFRSLRLPDGRSFLLNASPSVGLDTIYLGRPVKRAVHTTQNAPSFGQALRQQIKDQIQSGKQSALFFVRGQNKAEWVEEFLLHKLPYHPQWYRARTRFDTVLQTPLDFGEVSIPSLSARSLGQVPTAEMLAQVRLLTTITTADAHVGDPLDGVLAEPVFSPAKQLVLPVGTKFSGKVTSTQAARPFHRGGKLRFTFDRIDLPPLEGLEAGLPGGDRIQAQLSAIEADPDSIEVDSEGTVKTTESKTRFLKPILAGMTAVHSGDSDTDGNRGKGFITSSNVTERNLSGRLLGGFSGFGLLGTAASFGPRGIGMGLGYYGFAWSVYSNLIEKGRELRFEKNTALELRFGAIPHQANSH